MAAPSKETLQKFHQLSPEGRQRVRKVMGIFEKHGQVKNVVRSLTEPERSQPDFSPTQAEPSAPKKKSPAAAAAASPVNPDAAERDNPSDPQQ